MLLTRDSNKSNFMKAKIPGKRKQMIMKLTIKLQPPYCKKGYSDERIIRLNVESIDLQELARHLAREWKDTFNYALFDDKKLLTAEFIVNGKHVLPDRTVKDGDQVTIIPYICGG